MGVGVVGASRQRPGSPECLNSEQELAAVAPRALYPEPPLPAHRWPPEKPPTLEQMERDMRVWSQTRYEVVELATYEGQKREHRRAQVAFAELLRRYEHVCAAHKTATEQHEAQIQRAITMAKEAQEAAMARLDATMSQAKEARVHSFAKLAARRMLQRDLSLGFCAFLDCWRDASAAKQREQLQSKHEAEAKALQQQIERATAGAEVLRGQLSAEGRMLQASREQLDALQQALQATVTEAATKEADLRRQLDEARASAEARARESIGEAYLQLESLRQSLARAQDDAQHAAEAHAAELARLRASHVAEIATLRADMEAQAAAHAGDVDQMISAHLSRQMAEKADLVMKAAARRMRARGLTLGFNAWADFWAAKTAAMRRMREIANRLHPATTMIASAFYVWAEEASNANLAAERQLLEKQHGKLKLMLELRDKEIVRLKAAITKLLPPEKAGAYATSKREKQRRAMERKQQERGQA